jgi:predicted nucleic acid-binding Zn ribbon protein
MIGIRKIQVIFDGSIIFVGDVRKSGGTSRD